MIRFKSALLSTSWVVAALAATGCREADTDQARHAPEQAQTSVAPLPPPSPWAAKLMGENTKTGFIVSDDCIGAFDVIKVRHMGAQPGVEVEGWGWLKKETAAPTRIVLADDRGMIVGSAETVRDRPDVPAAIPIVTSQRVGWRGVAKATSGILHAVALITSDHICELGRKGIDAPS